MAGADAHFYRPADGTGLPHDPLNAMIGPRPIGWISTVSPTGTPNLAPYSYVNAFSHRPPILGFASDGWKDSVSNASATGAFVWNVANGSLAEELNETSRSVGPDVDEFILAGVTAVPSAEVVAPRVAESPANLECRVTRIMRLTGADGREVDTWLTLGEVVAVHIDRRHLVDGIYDTFGARPILRAGGPADYAQIDPDVAFRMRRPAEDDGSLTASTRGRST